MSCDLESVYREFDAPLRRFIHSRVRDAAAADDILQEVYLRVHSRIHTVRDCARLSGWLHQVARNAIVDHHRGRRPSEEVSETLPAAEDAAGDEAIRELAQGLDPMIEALPVKYRQALRLVLGEGLTQEQVAARLGLSLSGAKSRIQRARDRLKDMLLDCCHFELDRSGHVIGYEERCCCCATGRPSTAGRTGSP